MLSPEILSGNIAALTEAQGSCPRLGSLREALRVRPMADEVAVDLQTDAGWQPIDFADAATAQEWLKNALGRDGTQLVIAGIGTGRVLDRADAIGLKKVVVIETDPGIATLFLSRRDWRAWIRDGRLRLLTGPDFRGAADAARIFDGLQDLPVAAHPRRAGLEPRAMDAAVAIGDRIAKNARANGEARRKFAGPYLLQTLGNLPAIAREAGVEALDRAFAGVPAVVVGAGPSLDGNLEALRDVQDRAVIITADTALGPLIGAGIRPHLAVAADSSALNARHLASVADVAGVALVAEGSVHPTALDRFAGRTFTFLVSGHDPWPWLRAAGIARGGLRTWGSVLTSAFDLARRLGCDPIVFAGADLAFTGGRPYCRGTIYDAMWQEWIDKGCTWEQLMADYFSRQPEVWLDDVRGERVRTAPHLVSFRNWIVEETTRTPAACVNATGGGILYGGSLQQSTIGNALSAAAPAPAIREMLRDRHAAYRSSRDDVNRLDVLLARARATPDGVPFTRWLEATVSTVTTGQIAEALALPAPAA